VPVPDGPRWATLQSAGVSLTAQAFRQLTPATRTKFKKHTPTVGIFESAVFEHVLSATAAGNALRAVSLGVAKAACFERPPAVEHKLEVCH